MISLETIKKHLRIDWNDDDDYLLILKQAARRHSINYCDREIVDSAEELTADAEGETCWQPVVADADIDLAELQMIAHWYRNREAVLPGSMSDVPMSARAILDFYRRKSL